MNKVKMIVNEKFNLPRGTIIEKSKIFDASGCEDAYIVFFDKFDAAIYSHKSKFVTKIKTDDLNNLIESGFVSISYN